MQGSHIAILILLVAFAAFAVMGFNSVVLPYLLALSTLRLLMAYGLTLIFSISVGILLAHNNKAFRILFPFFDILQSVPVLGFLPFGLVFLIELDPVLGREVTTLLLIFTSMTWAVLFNVIEGIRVIPNDIRDSVVLNQISGWDYFTNVLIPAIYPAVISGSIPGWGNAWYFLVVGEYLNFGSHSYTLQGIGHFIAESAYSGDIYISIISVAVLGSWVLVINKLVWQPLLFRAKKYSYSSNEFYVPEKSNILLSLLDRSYVPVRNIFEKLFRNHINWSFKIFNIQPAAKIQEEKKTDYVFLFSIAFILLALFILFVGYNSIIKSPIDLFFSLLKTDIRLLIAYVLSLVWTVITGIIIGRSKTLMKYFLPFLDIAQSIPPVAIFPIIVVTIIGLLGTNAGLEVASIVLIMTGTQWYLIFNIVRAVHNLPNDFIELSKSLRLTQFQSIRNILFPAIIPAIFLGSIQAVGGGLNATIVSEYLIYKNKPVYIDGIGSLMALATDKADISGILITLFTMILMVIVLDRLVWRPLVHKIERYKV